MTGSSGRASLAMYDMPEFGAARRDWWRGLARAMRAEGLADVPEQLDGVTDLYAHWTGADLLFSQTCGYPLTHALAGKVTVVATPGYSCEGCSGTNYSSMVLVRDDDPAKGPSDLRGRPAVINSIDSQSGFSALRSVIAPLAEEGCFFSAVGVSGAHAASMQWVKEQKADVCAVDAVTFALAARYRPALTEGLRVLAHSPEAPSLPYITAGGSGEERLKRLRSALFQTMESPDLASAREALLMTGCEVLPANAYDRILELENQAIALGYAEVA